MSQPQEVVPEEVWSTLDQDRRQEIVPSVPTHRRACRKGRSGVRASGSAVFCHNLADPGQNLGRIARRHPTSANATPQPEVRYARIASIVEYYTQTSLTPITPSRHQRSAASRGSQPWGENGVLSTGASYPEIAANAALVLIGVAVALLDRQIEVQAQAFEDEGGFTERLYRFRRGRRR